MAWVLAVLAVLYLLTGSYSVSVVIIGRWWGVPGRMILGRSITILPVRAVAAVRVLIDISFSLLAISLALRWPQTGLWTVIPGVNLLIFIILTLLEGVQERQSHQRTPG